MRCSLASSAPHSHLWGSVRATARRTRDSPGFRRPPRPCAERPKARRCAIDRARPSREGKHRPALKLKGFRIVAKPELGTKRLCANCGAKFYDLSKDPIVCPKCATVFVPPVATRGRPEPVAPVVTPAVEGGDEVEVDDEALDDAAFIVPEEEEDEDVTDIIGEGIENDEET